MKANTKGIYALLRCIDKGGFMDRFITPINDIRCMQYGCYSHVEESLSKRHNSSLRHSINDIFKWSEIELNYKIRFLPIHDYIYSNFNKEYKK